MKRHYQIFHSKQGTYNAFKCDFCDEIFAEKRKLNDQIQTIHKKCSLCERIFTTNKSLESREIAIHKKRQSKHRIERDPDMKNHKNKRNN